MKKFNHYLLLSLLVIFSACQKSELETPEPESGIQDLLDLSIPDGFNFDTDRTVALNITDETPFVMYEVFGYSSNYGNEAENIAEAFNNLIFSGRPNNGVINFDLSLSYKYDKVYISRKDGLEYTYEIKDITNNTIDFTSPYVVRSKTKPAGPNTQNRAACPECLIIGVFTNGGFEDGPVLPTTFVQTNEGNVDGWDTTATDDKIEIWKTGFKQVISQEGEYHAELNATQPSALSQRICTAPGARIAWSVWHRGRDGVDVATVKIGTSEIAAPVVVTMTTSNVAGYVNPDGLGVANANGWIQYSGFYDVPALQVDTFFIFEAVSTASPNNSIGNFIDDIQIVEIEEGDCEGGTQILFYPAGGQQNATLGFEDLWSTTGVGDYDFNDCTMSYQVKVVCNADSEVLTIEYKYTVTSSVADFNNGFGLEFPGVLPSAVTSVTGQKDGYSGVEAGQANAVIRFFDNAKNECGTENTIIMDFVPPVPVADFGEAPFNPFLIVNNDRDNEIHLPEMARTTLGTVAAGPDDADGDYKADQGSTGDLRYCDGTVLQASLDNMPWALNIADNFDSMEEGITILSGYPQFQAWASSGGANNPQWFLPANRDNSMPNCISDPCLPQP
jgi:LruC domain-containing protein